MLEWREPPAGGRGSSRGRWAKIADQLKANPGEWALVARNEWAANASTSLQKYGCEVTCRGLFAGKAEEVYARFPSVSYEDYGDYMGGVESGE